MLESSFHEAIRLGNVAARLIYADWLEEQGRLVECGLLRSGRWCLIPAGTFWMGGGGGKPGKKSVTIARPFYLAAYAVTQREWQQVMGNNPSYFSRNGEGHAQVETISDAELAEFPVEKVTWNDVQEFIQRRNEQEKDNGWMVRLPSEAEWEYACRGAAITAEECSFDFYLEKPTNHLSGFQATINDLYLADSELRGINLERPTRVGSYPPNRLGLHDTHGNVWEWCEDLCRRNAPYRVLRGGCWGSEGVLCRAAERNCFTPNARSNFSGFRLAQSLSL